MEVLSYFSRVRKSQNLDLVPILRGDISKMGNFDFWLGFFIEISAFLITMGHFLKILTQLF